MRGSLKLAVRAWGPAILWMAFLFYLSAQSHLPGVPEAWLDILMKKTAHFLSYAVLARLYLRALGVYKGLPLAPALLALFLAAVYAATDEFHQYFVPGRTSSLTDWIIDCGGAAVGLLAPKVAERLRPGLGG